MTRYFLACLIAAPLVSSCSYVPVLVSVISVAGSSGGGGGGGGTGDVTAPVVVVSNPPRGAMLTGVPRALVSGTVVDESTIVSVILNGDAVVPDPSGNFMVEVPLQFGINVLKMEATDASGNQAHTHWAYLYSPTFLKADAPIPNATIARIANTAFNAIPPVLLNGLAGQGVVNSDKYGDLPLTLALQPTEVVQTFESVTAISEGSFVSSQPPVKQGPGIPSRGSPGVPTLEARQDVLIAIREDLINQALYTSWLAGHWQASLDQNVLESMGVTLPFALDAQLLAPFFPALAGLAGPKAPILIDFEPMLPPVVNGRGRSSWVRASVGELHIRLSVVGPQQTVQFLALVMHFNLPISIATGGTPCPHLRVGSPQDLLASILDNPYRLNELDINLLISVIRSSSFLADLIEQIPLPSIACMTLGKLQLHQSGGKDDYLKIYGELR